MSVTFIRQWFNPLYFILLEIAKDPTIRTVLIYGGKSSSKTVSISQFLVKENYIKGANIIAFRKESAIIKTTLKKSFNLAIDKMYLYPAYEKLELSYRSNVGSEIILKGLDDSEKAKGVESYKYIYLDELNHFEYEEFEQFNLSLRGIEGQKIFASWNPVDENSWVKTDLVDSFEWVDFEPHKLPCPESFVKKSTCGKAVLIKTTYEDNYWIVGSPCGTYGYRDQNLIDEYNALRLKNYNSYRVNVLGEWGKTNFGGEFLKSWRTEKHTGVVPYDPELPVHLIFDENVNPYFPCGIFQWKHDPDNKVKEIRLVHVIAKRNPENTTRAMCQEITRKLREWRHEDYVFIGGDPTSQKEDVKQEKGMNLFQLIAAELKEFKPRIAVAKSSPSVRMSADFFNAVLEYEEGGLKFIADKSCKIAILDYENTKEDKNGKVDKTTIRDPKTGITFQPYGHFVDLTRYFVCYTFPQEYAYYQKGASSGRIMLGNPKNNKSSY